VVPEALGTEYRWPTDGRTVTLMLPRERHDFVNADETETPVIDAWLPTARITGSGDAVAIQLLAVDVEFSGELSAADKQRATDAGSGELDVTLGRPFQRAAQLLWEEGHAVAEQAAHAWLADLRVVSAQPWLGLVIEPPLQHGRSHIFDDDAGERLMSFGPLQRVSMRSGQLALSLDDLTSIAERVAGGREPDRAEALLADARSLILGSDVVDAQRGVLVAAIACEIKTKDTMRQRVDPSAAGLLDVVLRRVSDLPRLLDEPLHGALGVTLKQADRSLYDRVGALATTRNHVVHRGSTVGEPEARQLVTAAGELFDWLNDL
jgi:hypothetical protein